MTKFAGASTRWVHGFIISISTASRPRPTHFLGDYPNVKWRRFSGVIPDRLEGKTVLDIGCNAGFYAMEMKRRGAERVLGLDTDEEYLEQARFAAEVNGLRIEFRKMSAYDVGELREQFDLVIFMGVLYHLRHPLLALDLIHEHVARRSPAVPIDAARRRVRSMRSTRIMTSGPQNISTRPAIRSCISSSTNTPMIRPIGGCRTAPASKPCCAAPVSPSPHIRKTRFISASGPSGRNPTAPSIPSGDPADDRSCQDLE